MAAGIDPKPYRGPSIEIVPVKLGHYKQLGSLAAKAYYPTVFTNFLAPGRIRYYSHYERDLQGRTLNFLLNPRARTHVACQAEWPHTPYGYIHLKRLGDDEGAKRVIREKDSVWLMILRWLVTVLFLVISVLLPNKAADLKNLAALASWTKEDNDKYWNSYKERGNRWHVVGFVVDPEYQRKGIGRLLMAQAVRMAEEDNVILGLESSSEGEAFYRDYGFEQLGKFTMHPGYEFLGDAGGFFMLTPPALKKAQQEDKEKDDTTE